MLWCYICCITSCEQHLYITKAIIVSSAFFEAKDQQLIGSDWYN